MKRIPRDPDLAAVRRALRDLLLSDDLIVRASAEARFVVWDLPAHPDAIVICARRLLNAERLDDRIRELSGPA